VSGRAISFNSAAIPMAKQAAGGTPPKGTAGQASSGTRHGVRDRGLLVPDLGAKEAEMPARIGQIRALLRFSSLGGQMIFERIVKKCWTGWENALLEWRQIFAARILV
jgi:hypothetical protein